MFEDDRKSTTSLADGAYSLITFRGEATCSTYEIAIDNEGTYADAPAQKQLTFVIHNVDSKPSHILVNDKKLRGNSVKYDSATSTLSISCDWDVDTTMGIKIIK